MPSITGPIARIDLNALAHNYREAQRLVGTQVEILAMVKANAYGHGDSRVARALYRAGCRAFGVATVAEAEVVRAAVADARVVIFGGLAPAEAARVVACGAEALVYDLDILTALGKAATTARREVSVHLEVDTGMRRTGADVRDIVALALHAQRTSGVRPVALCSHFAMAESVETEVTAGQLDALLAAAREVRELAGFALGCHLANSAAVMTRPDTHLDAVRPGLMLYGLYPDPALRASAQLRPVMTFQAPIVRVAEVGAGVGISYGHTYRTEGPARIATLRCGYADGYPRALSNRGIALVRGRRVPVAGRVCMDHVMLDVTEAGDVACGEVATLWGPELPTEEVARLADTIAYELVSRVSPRVIRVYEGG